MSKVWRNGPRPDVFRALRAGIGSSEWWAGSGSVKKYGCNKAWNEMQQYTEVKQTEEFNLYLLTSGIPFKSFLCFRTSSQFTSSTQLKNQIMLGVTFKT